MLVSAGDEASELLVGVSVSFASERVSFRVFQRETLTFFQVRGATGSRGSSRYLEALQPEGHDLIDGRMSRLHFVCPHIRQGDAAGADGGGIGHDVDAGHFT